MLSHLFRPGPGLLGYVITRLWCWFVERMRSIVDDVTSLSGEFIFVVVQQGNAFLRVPIDKSKIVIQDIIDTDTETNRRRCVVGGVVLVVSVENVHLK